MSIYRPKGSPYYHFDFQCGSVRFHGSTKQTERRLAEAVERAERKSAIASVGAARARAVGAMTFNAAAGRYWKEVGQHIATASETERNIERLVEWIGKDTLVADVTDELVARLVARRRGQYRRGEKRLGLISAAQVNRSVTQLLRRILTRARKVWKEPLPAEPNWTAHLLPEPRERTRELSYQEEERLEGIERADYQPARLFAQITGLRRREVVSLTWSQIDFDADVIRVVGKGDKPHIIPITPDLHALLWPLRKHHQTSVFTYVCQRTRVEPRTRRHLVAGERYPLTYWGLGSEMRRALEKAEVPDFRIHDLRHTGATRTLRATGNLKLVQKLLNHSSLRVTEKYAHASLDDLRDAMMQTASDDRRRRTKSRKNSQITALDWEK
ncbi:site-specific integrase [Methylobacterium organophilum]|uniref:tyrosine-type recombinase/integrase n=1 Tax=Methylobacterium organophilum TaxID=410 RepID=UPI001F1316D8|nr:site-specific integrase [Methylobacterium organophilum]UMY18666.1 site-specific integrase [Methylobacterium organophilum]